MFKKALLVLLCAVFACLSVSAKKGEFKYDVFDVDSETNEVNLKTVSYNLSDFIGGLRATLIYDKDGCRLKFYFTDSKKNAASSIEPGFMCKFVFEDDSSLKLFYDGVPVAGKVSRSSQGDYNYTAYTLEFVLANSFVEKLCNSPIKSIKTSTTSDKTGPKRSEKFRQAAIDFYSYVPKATQKMGTDGVVLEVEAQKPEVRYLVNKVDEFTKQRTIETDKAKISSTLSIGFMTKDKDYAITMHSLSDDNIYERDLVKFVFDDMSANVLTVTNQVSKYENSLHNTTVALECNRDMIEKFAKKTLMSVSVYSANDYRGNKRRHGKFKVKTPEMAANVKAYAQDFLSKAKKLKNEEEPDVKLADKVYPKRNIKGSYYDFDMDEADENWYIHSWGVIKTKGLDISFYYAKEWSEFKKLFIFKTDVPYSDLYMNSNHKIYLKLDNDEILKLDNSGYNSAKVQRNASVYAISGECNIDFNILKTLSEHKISKIRFETTRSSTNASYNVEIDIDEVDSLLMQLEALEMLGVLDPRK